jgi:hypothetical protein
LADSHRDGHLTLTPLASIHLDHAVRAGRIRRVTYAKTFAGLTLNDGTILKVTSEAEAWIAIRAMASASHAGMTPEQARVAERVAFGASTAGDNEETAPK